MARSYYGSHSYYSRGDYARGAYFGGSEQHPGCPRGCGELADECACPPAQRNPLGSMTVNAPVKGADVYAEADYDLDLPMPCRWRNCTQDADSKGYCDAHLGTL